MKTPMRCCKKCGCYLPDNSTRCLACGYDERYGISAAASASPPKKAGYLWEHMPVLQATMDKWTVDPGLCTTTDLKCRSVTAGLKYRYVTAGDTGKDCTVKICFGYSYDEKPEHQLHGTRFVEMDTGRTYTFNERLMQWGLDLDWM